LLIQKSAELRKDCWIDMGMVLILFAFLRRSVHEVTAVRVFKMLVINFE